MASLPIPQTPNSDESARLPLEIASAANEPIRGSLLRPGENCVTVARAERVAFLVDGEDYFRAFYQAAQLATRSIVILGWDFHSRTRLVFDEEAASTKDAPPPIMGDFLNFLVRRRRGLQVHVLIWDYPMIFGIDRELPPHYGFGWSPRRRVRFRYDNTHPLAGSHHQKIVVIDDALAFTGGLDFTTCRWDTRRHAPDEKRRLDASEKPYAPFHDMMAAVDGEAARALGTIACQRWLEATGSELPRIKPAKGDPWPQELAPVLRNVDVGIARTMPPTATRPGVREVEKLYLDMIAAARRTIYIENQYFTSQKLADALQRRLEEPDGPEIILVLRLMSHGWLEEHTMHVLRSKLIKQLRAADKHGKFHVCYPHVDGLAAEKCIDIHSKLMIVDDDLLRIGSANLCNRSMGMDTECDVLIEAKGDPEVSRAIVEFRNGLLAEHLGVQDACAVGECLSSSSCLREMIETLGRPERRLAVLEQLPEWSEAVVSVAAIADPNEPISVEGLTSDLHADDEPRPAQGPAWGKLAAIVLVIAALFALWRFTPLSEVVTAERMSAWADEFGGRPWVPFVILIAYTPACFIMFPRPLITLAAVLAFGPWMGMALAFGGILISASATYYAGRLMKHDTVHRLAGKRLTPVIRVLRERGFVAMFLVRIVPVAPYAVVGMVAGAIRVKLWQYLLATLLGMAPGVIAATVFGDQLSEALSKDGSINWWLVGGVVTLFAVGMALVKRWFKRNHRDLHPSHNARLRKQPS